VGRKGEEEGGGGRGRESVNDGLGVRGRWYGGGVNLRLGLFYGLYTLRAPVDSTTSM
jgi:hypothetical protein